MALMDSCRKYMKRDKWKKEKESLKADGFVCKCGSKKLKATRKGVLCRKCGQYVASDNVVKPQAVDSGQERIKESKSLFRKYLGWS